MTTSTDQNTIAPQATQSMEELLQSPAMPAIPKVGDLVRGTVISLGRNEVRIDLQGITTGVARGSELYDESGEYSTLALGDTVDATVIELENENGEVELSFLDAGRKKAWEKLHELRKQGTIITVTIVGANKGGLLVKLGKTSGFLPVSQLAPENYPRIEDGDKNKIFEHLQKFMSKTLDVKVIDALEQDDKLIVSEKAAWEERQREILGQYKVGDVVEGTITGIVDFGAFLELPHGLEGLIHISEIAWQRLDHPRDVLAVGQKVQAQIISIDGSRISLSLKRLAKDPWADVLSRYTVGQTVQGKVLKVNPFGLFVELDPEIHGLAHISELSHKPIADARTIAKSGDVVDFRVISIEPKEHRLGLSIKALSQPIEPPEPLAEQTVTPPPSEETPTEKADGTNV